MTEFWRGFVRPIDVDRDIYMSLIIDVGLFDLPVDKTRPCLMVLSLDIHDPNESGFQNEEEGAILDKLEDDLAELLEDKLGAVYACRTTCEAVQNFYFYIKNKGNFEQEIVKFNQGYPHYPLSCEFRDDPEWKCYFEDMFPTRDEFILFDNFEMALKLEMSGFPMNSKTMINHNIYFPNSRKRDDFVDEILKEGFAFANYFVVETDEAELCGVIIEREDVVELDNINELVFKVLEVAEKYEGEYDSWNIPDFELDEDIE